MTFKEFTEKYHPVKNTFDISSPFNGSMFETDDDEQREFVLEKPSRHVWSYLETGELQNGLSFSPRVLGYLVCLNEENERPGHVKISI